MIEETNKKRNKYCYPSARDGDDSEECTYTDISFEDIIYSYYMKHRIDPSR